MADGDDLHSLDDVLVRLSGIDGDEVSIMDIVDAIGHRSFGPLLLVPGLIMLSPLSGIPTLPTICAVLVVLVVGQMLVGRRCLWLPGFVARRSIGRDKLAKAIAFLRPVARVVDRLTGPRLSVFTRGPFARAIPAACLLIALTVPFLEVLPFVSSASGAAIIVLALAMVARDGLLALLALVCVGGGIGVAVALWR